MPGRPYVVEFSTAASKQLAKLDKPNRERIAKALRELAADPRGQQSQVKPLKGEEAGAFRLRVAEYRIVYDLYDSELVVWVIEVAHRGNVKRYR